MEPPQDPTALRLDRRGSSRRRGRESSSSRSTSTGSGSTARSKPPAPFACASSDPTPPVHSISASKTPSAPHPAHAGRPGIDSTPMRAHRVRRRPDRVARAERVSRCAPSGDASPSRRCDENRGARRSGSRETLAGERTCACWRPLPALVPGPVGALGLRPERPLEQRVEQLSILLGSGSAHDLVRRAHSTPGARRAAPF